MFKWLILLCGFLYCALLLGGTDHGQLRAGLRDIDQPVKRETVQVAAPAPVAQVDDTIIATNLVPMLPEQPIRVLPRTAMPEPIPVAAQPTEQPENTDLRWVNVDRANVRAAAHKGANVTGSIDRGESVLVLWTEPNGWARVRIEGDGVDGFIHQSLLTEIDPLAIETPVEQTAQLQ